MQTLLDTGACDAAALQNERSAWMQSIHDRSSTSWHWTFSWEEPLSSDNVKTEETFFCGLCVLSVLHSAELIGDDEYSLTSLFCLNYVNWFIYIIFQAWLECY